MLCVLCWCCAREETRWGWFCLPGVWSPVTSPSPSVSSVMGCVAGVSSVLSVLLLGRRWSPYAWRSVLPSDLFRRGSFGWRGLRVRRGEEYASAAEKADVHALGRLYGCHHCGQRINTEKQRVSRLLRTTTAAPVATDGVSLFQLPEAHQVVGFVADHIPPNKYNRHGDAQTFYPQCPRCSLLQSHAVKADRRTLVRPHWSRFTASDFFFPSPLLLLPALTMLNAIIELAQRPPL